MDIRSQWTWSSPTPIRDLCRNPRKVSCKPDLKRASSIRQAQRERTMKNTIRSLRAAASGLALLTCAASVAYAADPLKVGLLEDVSGDLALMGMPKLHGSELAVEEINKAGGIMGRQIELIHL